MEIVCQEGHRERQEAGRENRKRLERKEPRHYQGGAGGGVAEPERSSRQPIGGTGQHRAEAKGPADIQQESGKKVRKGAETRRVARAHVSERD